MDGIKTFKTRFWANVTRLMDSMHLTSETAADSISVNSTYFSEALESKSDVPLEMALELSFLLRTTLNELVENKDKSFKHTTELEDMITKKFKTLSDENKEKAILKALPYFYFKEELDEKILDSVWNKISRKEFLSRLASETMRNANENLLTYGEEKGVNILAVMKEITGRNANRNLFTTLNGMSIYEFSSLVHFLGVDLASTLYTDSYEEKETLELPISPMQDEYTLDGALSTLFIYAGVWEKTMLLEYMNTLS